MRRWHYSSLATHMLHHFYCLKPTKFLLMNMFNICKVRPGSDTMLTYISNPTHQDSLAKKICLLICLINSDKSLHRLGGQTSPFSGDPEMSLFKKFFK